MRKEIDVYNAYFGDCIILKDIDDSSNLLVDFGIHNSSVVSSIYTSKNDLTDSIAKNISSRYSNKKLSLLITHFHDDHVSGLVHMYQSNNPAYKGLFKSIYIANIWDDPFAIAYNLLENILLNIQLQGIYLPRTTTTLFDLLGFLQSSAGTKMLLSRGITFENDKYITLWPPKGKCTIHIPTIFNELGLPSELVNELLALSEMVCEFVKNRIIDNGTDTLSYTNDANANMNLNDLRTRFVNLAIRLQEYFDNDDESKTNYIRKAKEKLHNLNHNYNIVFQNKDSNDDNILFTGDVKSTHMDEIAKAKDITLHPSYKFIKIPHHGTEAHYYDFSSYNPKYVVITNGKVSARYADSYKISGRFGTLNAIHICANSNHCINCTAKCSDKKKPCANNRRLVYSHLYINVK